MLDDAVLTVDPARAREFEASFARLRPSLELAHGALSMHLERCIDQPASYRLQVEWPGVDQEPTRWHRLLADLEPMPVQRTESPVTLATV